jgi:hypothetical protein
MKKVANPKSPSAALGGRLSAELRDFDYFGGAQSVYA